ncbi:Myosin type-2 heavy chain 1, partial [Entophlyctis luteolus]
MSIATPAVPAPPPPPPSVSSLPGNLSFDLSLALLDYRAVCDSYIKAPERERSLSSKCVFNEYFANSYFPDDVDGWIMGEAVADATVVNGSFVVDFRLENGQLRAFKADLRGITGASDLPPLKNPDFMDQVNDLSLLSYLHEPAVFWGIKNRFMSGDIYTYSGMVLIAMNPFQHVDLYSVDIMRDYVGKKRDDLVPHIYGIAEECYKAMLNGQNQSVIVSGESGAGKTQSTKYIMQYLAVVDTLSKQNSVEALMRPESFGKNIQRSETEEAVLASNPILE